MDTMEWGSVRLNMLAVYFNTPVCRLVPVKVKVKTVSVEAQFIESSMREGRLFLANARVNVIQRNH